MATLEELQRALKNADKAGDTRAAQTLAAEIAKMQPSHIDKVRSDFSALPWYKQAGQAVDDTVRNFADTISFGLANRLAAAGNGTDLEAERQKSDDARTRAGSAAIGTDILALMGPGGLASKGVSAVLPALRGSGLLRTVGREALAGGGIGAGMATGNGDNPVDGAAGGILGGAAGGAVGSTLGNVLEKTNILPGILSRTGVGPKTTAQLRAGKEAAYDAVDNSGIGYSPGDVGRMLRDTRRQLSNEGIDPELHSRATRRQNLAEERVANANGDLPLSEIDIMRRLIGRDVSGNQGERAMGGIMRENLDNFLATVPPNSGGKSAAEASDMITGARAANRRFRVSQDLDAAAEETANSASGGLSPYRRLLNSGPDGWNPEERNLLRNVVRGQGWDEALSRTGVGIASHLGSVGSGATAGGILAGPVGAAIGGISGIALPPLVKRSARNFTQRNIEALRDSVGEAQRIPSWLNWIGEQASGGITAGTLDQQRRFKRRRRRSRNVVPD